ncbi:MAG: MoaD/ThiS family protein [Chloroflexi bacterium]|nr:MoaD/ThiS family protein [Chloroflexota bacterium]
MSVKINVHPALAHLTGDNEKVEVSGSTVGQCLDQLVARFPAIKSWLFAKSGKLNNTVEIYVNSKSSYPEELAMPVKDGDELQIVTIIIGG